MEKSRGGGGGGGGGLIRYFVEIRSELGDFPSLSNMKSTENSSNTILFNQNDQNKIKTWTFAIPPTIWDMHFQRKSFQSRGIIMIPP